MDGAKSDFVPVDCSVPRGLVLGPTLFPIYINNLPEGINSKVCLFADDTMCSKTIITEDDQQVLQEALKTLASPRRSNGPCTSILRRGLC